MRALQAASSAAVSSAGAPSGGVAMTWMGLAQRLVVHTKGHAFTDQPGGVEDLLDLGGADPVARGLHHLVAAAHEVQKALGIAAHRVAGEHGDLGQLHASLAATHAGRQRLVALGVFSASFQ